VGGASEVLPWGSLVSKDHKTVVLATEFDEMDRFGEVAGVDAIGIDMKLHDTSGEGFVLAFLQELLFPQLIESQRLPNT
jgi:hypothetical protein